MLLLVGLCSCFEPVACRHDTGTNMVGCRCGIGGATVAYRHGTGSASSGIFSNGSEGIWTVDAGRSVHRASPPSPLALVGTAARALRRGRRRWYS